MESSGDKFVIFDKNHKHGVFDQPLFEISINLNLFSPGCSSWGNDLFLCMDGKQGISWGEKLSEKGSVEQTRSLGDRAKFKDAFGRGEE